MVMVYQFKGWDQIKGDMIPSRSKMTAERIKELGGEIIEESVEDVPEDALDAEGRYGAHA